MKSSILLAPWEHNGQMPQVLQEGELFHEGALVRFELLGPSNARRQNERRLVFRRGDDDGRWTTYPAPSSRMSADSFYIERSVQNALGAGKFKRYLYFDSEMAQLFSEGRGFWCAFDNWWYKATRCPFVLPNCIFGMTSSQTRSWFLALLDDPSSDAAFSLCFKQNGRYEKKLMMFGCLSEGEFLWRQNELERLCRLVLYSDDTLWDKQSSVRWWFQIGSSFGQPQFRFLLPTNGGKCLETPFLTRWAELLGRFGPLIIQRDRGCVREYLPRDSILASGDLDAPTFHERMEARLELREWCQARCATKLWAEVDL